MLAGVNCKGTLLPSHSIKTIARSWPLFILWYWMKLWQIESNNIWVHIFHVIFHSNIFITLARILPATYLDGVFFIKKVSAQIIDFF